MTHETVEERRNNRQDRLLAVPVSRSTGMLFFNTNNHIAELGDMTKYMMRYKDYFQGCPGYERYEGYLNWRVTVLSEVLQE